MYKNTPFEEKGYDFQSVYLSIFGFQFTLELKSPQFPFTGKPKAYKPRGFGGSAPIFYSESIKKLSNSYTQLKIQTLEKHYLVITLIVVMAIIKMTNSIYPSPNQTPFASFN